MPKDGVDKRHVELRELTHDERLALVGLVELVTGADREISDDELAKIRAVATALGGDDAYRAAADEIDRRFPTLDAFRAFLSTIVRREAHELIYGTVLDAAVPDAIGPPEARVLEEVAREWGISVRAPGR